MYPSLLFLLYHTRLQSTLFFRFIRYNKKEQNFFRKKGRILMQPTVQELLSSAQEIKQEILADRRTIHQNPEVGM